MWWIILFILLVGIIVLILRRKRRNKTHFAERHEPINNNVGAIHESPKITAESSAPAPVTQTQEFIAMRVMANDDQPYAGYELLQTLLANGFRFGNMNIFHRHEKTNGEGSILFSLASATEPGTFDLENMGKTSCHGLTMFMRFDDLDGEIIPKFNLMLETARQLIDDLGGKILNEQNQSLNQTVIEKWQTKIKHYEDKKYSYDLFEGQ